jgi:Xaa-Pro aminopeptidase
MQPAFATFPEEEHRERLQRARTSLRGAGLEGCICASPENLYYLIGYDSWTAMNNPQALVISAKEGEPTLLVRDVDLPLVLECTSLRDVRTYRLNGEDPAAIIAGIAKEKGLRGRIGADLQSAAMPGAFTLALMGALDSARLEDVSLLLGDLRLRKSAREMALIRKAANFARAGLEAAHKALRVGRTEIEVAADVEMAMRSAGSDYWAIPTEFTAGPRSAGCHGTPRARVIGSGELAHFEFAGVAARYHATAFTTMAVGEPGNRARDLYRISNESLCSGMAAAKPDCLVADIAEASLRPLRSQGLEKFAMMRFGYGLGIGYPPIWLETLQIDSFSKQRLETGMVFVLHACLELADEGLGTIVGGTYTLGKDGLEMLVGEGAVDLAVV